MAQVGDVLGGSRILVIAATRSDIDRSRNDDTERSCPQPDGARIRWAAATQHSLQINITLTAGYLDEPSSSKHQPSSFCSWEPHRGLRGDVAQRTREALRI